MQQTVTQARTIEEFLQQSVANPASAEAIRRKWDERRNTFLQEVQALFDDITGWINELQRSGPVEYKFEEPYLIYEDGIGSYKAPVLSIFVGERSMVFRPVGTKIYGAFGRIDVYAGFHLYHLILTDWGGKWQRDSASRIPPTEFNQEDFKTILLTLVSGQ